MDYYGLITPIRIEEDLVGTRVYQMEISRSLNTVDVVAIAKRNGAKASLTRELLNNPRDSKTRVYLFDDLKSALNFKTEVYKQEISAKFKKIVNENGTLKEGDLDDLELKLIQDHIQKVPGAF